MKNKSSTEKAKILRIANASGYWGDDPTALARQVRGGNVDYITMDFLAEITMSIMQKQRAKDPNLGYARDFIGMLASILPEILQKKIRIIANAGGVNPKACAKAIMELSESLNLKPKIAIVHGDDILEDLPNFTAKNIRFDNMETNEPFSKIEGRVQAANVYFGAKPVAEALKWAPDILITGRVTDTGITLGPMIHEFGWSYQDWDRLASGIIAGHMIECGSQVTGGNFSDWHKVKSFHNMGYPIVEVQDNGNFYITKHPKTGGLVSVDTVREQLVYEMGNPKAYITPDVVADFSSIQLKAAGKDRVFVSGIRGFEPTDRYKVSMAYEDGYKCQGSIAISGPNAREKAELFSEIFWQRLSANTKKDDFLAKETEFFGWNACHRSLGFASEGNEIVLRLGVRSAKKEPLQMFSKLIPSLILGGPSGVMVLGGAPKAQDVISYWPALMPKSSIRPKITLFDKASANDHLVEEDYAGQFAPIELKTQVAKKASAKIAKAISIAKKSSSHKVLPLHTICLARSGDKGDTANIGVLARSPKAYQFIQKYLTAERVKNWFQELCFGRVIRYELDNLQGLNFLLEASLGGGGTMTLRADAQGKTFAQALLRQHAPIPQDVLREVAKLSKSS